jgi:hypothetical protein
MKKIVLLAMGLVMSMTAMAQDEIENENKVETTISGDIVSRYIWRGQDLGDVSLQPTLGIGYKGLSLTAWGSVGLTNSDDTKEFDLTLAYTTGGFNIGITDYWFNAGLDPDNRYFMYNAHSTNHVFEANIGYDFGFASLQWYTNFAGNDGVNESGKRAYSSYFEVNVPFKVATVDWTATAGAVPYATTFYNGWTSGFSVTNLALKATKDIKITDSFSIPIFGQVVANPRTQKAYLVLGFTLQPSL